MNQHSAVFLASLVSAVVAWGTVRWTSAEHIQPSTQPSQDTYDRVQKTGVLRCGYVSYPPGLTKDPRTGQVSGIFPDVLREIGQNLGFKVQWSEEVGWGTMVEGLNSGHYDAICSPVWPIPQRIRVADFTVPLYYSGAEAYIRPNDKRFAASLGALNDPQMRIATTDGEASDAIASADFPNAQRISTPQLTDVSQLLLMVATNKADATFIEPYIAHQFLKSNPGSLEPARPGVPLRLYPNVMMLRQQDDRLRRILDNAITDLENNGYIEKILDQNEPYRGAFYRKPLPIEPAGAANAIQGASKL